MQRPLKIFVGSAISAALGLAVGFLAASAYVWRYYPDDPDPVDFVIGALLLLPCLGIWLAGTAITLWRVLCKSSNNAA
jgi:hypothetical protein